MSYYCDPCDRWFNTENGYDMHIENSAAHRPYDDEDWECEICDRSFATRQSRHQHYSNAAGHPYCVSCERMFRNQNNLNMHMRSKVHVGSAITCPWCKNNYATASGLTIHLESGSCSSGLNRAKINTQIRQLDRRNVITTPLLTMGDSYEDTETTATERAWNGDAYECYFCPREFGSLTALNQHLRSPAHERDNYHCPKAGCNRTYKLLSGLVQHVESESCGLMTFGQTQQEAQAGIRSMVGRMIRG